MKEIRNMKKGKMSTVNNIVLIAVDTLRADHLSCYGYHRPNSPTIDRLATEGTRFTDCFSQTTHTIPSFTSLLTGLSPVSHGIVGTIWCIPNENIHVLDDNIPMLAEFLQKEDYLTCAIDNLHAMDCNPKWFPRGFEYYISKARVVGVREEESLHGKSYLQRQALCSVLAEELNKTTISWLHNHVSEKFFLFIHYWDPHQPYNQPEPYRSIYSHEEIESKIYRTRSGVEYINGWGRVADVGAKERGNIDLYDGEINYVDEQIRHLLDTLRELNLYDDTLIIFTSDHGETMAEHHSFFNHREVYDAVTHVPLIIKPPNGLVKKRLAVSEALVQNADVFSTILDVAGVKFARPPAAHGSGCDDGRSLLPILYGELSEHRTYVYSTGSWVKDGQYWKAVEIAIRNKEYKFIHRADISRLIAGSVPSPYGFIGLTDFFHPEKFQSLPKRELLNLATSPEELHNVIDEEQEQAAKMEEQLKEWVESEVFLK